MDSKMYDIIYCLMIPELGSAGLAKLVRMYDSYENIRCLSEGEIRSSRIIGKAGREALLQGKVEQYVDKALAIIEKEGISMCAIGEDEYPKSLYDMQNPPPILFYKGKLQAKERRISIIGSRACSHYGMTVAEEIGRRSGKCGITTVSGLAEGVDGLIHRSTAEAGGRTIAVVAGNIDKPYPADNRRLIGPILDAGGCVLTEVPPGKPIYKADFILRNRIIAALGTVLVVVEAGNRSGCFSTVDYMNDLGREIYAVPGNITSLRSQGTNKMLQQGAHVYTSYDDFMIDSGLGVFAKKHDGFTSQGIELSNLDKRLLAEIQSTPCTVEQLSLRFDMDAGTIAQSLTFLTLFGEANEVTPGWFVGKSC